MPSEVRLEPMRDAHAEAVLSVYGAGIATGDATFESRVPAWAEFDAARSPEHRYVALDGDTVLGWVAVSPTSARPVYRGVVEDALYVAPEARGRGVGRALLERLLASCDAGDVWTVVAGIFPENAVSLALHESVGFRRVGVRERLGLMQHGPHAGTWRDVLWLERRRPD